MKEINICFVTDNNYAPYCGVAVKSMLVNAAPEDRLHIYIFHSNLHPQHMDKFRLVASVHECELDFITVDARDFQSMPVPIGKYFTVEAYFIFSIARMLPTIDKIIYLDCDVLVRGSLAELYNMDIKDQPAAMAKICDADSSDRSGYNSGVILFNSKKWREDDIEKSLFEFVNYNKGMEFPCVDQDVLNMVLKDSFFEISSDWNFQLKLFSVNNKRIFPADIDESVKIVHYCMNYKPWHGMYDGKAVDLYYHYVNLIPWDIPDKRDRMRSNEVNALKYYDYRGIFYSFLNQRALSRRGHLLILTEVGDDLELEYAALDLGISSLEVISFRESDLHCLKYDHLIVVCANILIMDDMMKSYGYYMDKLDYLCIAQKKDDEQIIAEYKKFLSGDKS